MATKKETKKIEAVEVPTQVQEEVKPAMTPMVLSRYRVEKFGDNDAHVFERIRLSPKYAGTKGVKEFVSHNGRITYYTEKLVKKYSDNVVKA